FKDISLIATDDHNLFRFGKILRHRFIVLHPLLFSLLVNQDKRQRYLIQPLFDTNDVAGSIFRKFTHYVDVLVATGRGHLIRLSEAHIGACISCSGDNDSDRCSDDDDDEDMRLFHVTGAKLGKIEVQAHFVQRFPLWIGLLPLSKLTLEFNEFPIHQKEVDDQSGENDKDHGHHDVYLAISPKRIGHFSVLRICTPGDDAHQES